MLTSTPSDADPDPEEGHAMRAGADCPRTADALFPGVTLRCGPVAEGRRSCCYWDHRTAQWVRLP